MNTQDSRFIRYVILLTHTGKTPMTEPVIRAHVAHIKRLDEKGQYVLGGPFEDHKGGMMIIKAESLEAAQEIAQADPFIKEGVETCEVRTWELSCAENNHLGMG